MSFGVTPNLPWGLLDDKGSLVTPRPLGPLRPSSSETETTLTAEVAVSDRSSPREQFSDSRTPTRDGPKDGPGGSFAPRVLLPYLSRLTAGARGREERGRTDRVVPPDQV